MKFRNYLFGTFLLILFLLNQVVWGQSMDLAERIVAVTVTDINPTTAKKSLQDLATKKVASEMVREVIGDEKYQKNLKKIEVKILKQTARFIPFVKVIDWQANESQQQSRANVQVKVSLVELNTLLQDLGLLAESESSGMILPLFVVTDRVRGQDFNWWLGAPNEKQTFLFNLGKSVENSFRNIFFKSNFYLVKAIDNKLQLQVPTSLKHERLNMAEMYQIARHFSAPIMLDGQISIQPSTLPDVYFLELKFDLYQVSTGRLIASVVRKFETEKGTFERVVSKKLFDSIEAVGGDLIHQAREMWQRGGVSARKLQLVLQGHLHLKQLEALKEQLRKDIPQVRKMSERWIQSDTSIFDVETSLTTEELAAKMENMKVTGFGIKKVGIESGNLIYKIIN